MKKTFTLFCISALWGYGSLSAQTQIDNGNLDSWNNMGSYEEPAGTMLKTLNSLTSLGVPVTVTKTSDAKSNLAAELKSNTLVALNIFIPGVLATIQVQTAPPAAFLGVPFTEKPTRFKGWYKYSPVQGDSAEILIALMKRNGAVRDTVGRAAMKIKNSVAAYTPFDMPITYYSTTLVPDSLIILCVSSAGYNFSNLLACAGKNNSTLWVDELELEYSSGLSESYPGLPMRLWPNPTRDVLHIGVEGWQSHGALVITDATGRQVAQHVVTQWPITLNVQGFPSGPYHLKVIEGQRIISRGSFILQ
ncbi:MAG: PCMD domain-containing protein [Flavobacteriales bacterium]|nr:PCMD domain-containing protein [Flavobacteriales bacterium]